MGTKPSAAEWVGAQGNTASMSQNLTFYFGLGSTQIAVPQKGLKPLLIHCSHHPWPHGRHPEQKRGKKGNCCGERRDSVLANGPPKDFQLSWDLPCAVIVWVL